MNTDRDTLTWAGRAFALTVLVLLVATLVAQPLVGRAQSDGAGARPDPQAGGAPPNDADDGGSRSNLEAMVLREAARSDSELDEAVPDAAGYGAPLVVAAADFSSDGGNPDGFHFDFAGGYVNGDGTACIKAPAYLPAGATVFAVYASLYDNATGNIAVRLRRVNVYSGLSDVMASLYTESEDTAIQQRGDDTIGYPEVVYPDYAYYLTTCLTSADHRLYSVRIYYTGP